MELVSIETWQLCDLFIVYEVHKTDRTLSAFGKLTGEILCHGVSDTILDSLVH